MKKLLFVSGTRADFGKLKPLVQICRESPTLDVHIFATGMHLHHQYGYTLNEIHKSGFGQVFPYINYTSETSMDLTLAKTIEGLSSFVKEMRPDLLIVHGDRPETLAGAIVGALNNLLVGHVEGGEVSGTIDELIRHSVSKLSHLHFVANHQARQRLVQMGERSDAIHEIGSPDVDIMFSDQLPSLSTVLDHYQIPFDRFAILLFHPVTTEVAQLAQHADALVTTLLEADDNYVVVYPNNDLGSSLILNAYQRLAHHARFKIFPSLRFEFFLTLLKHCQYLIGNSSAGIREAPYYGIPSINIGTRQNNRALASSIVHADYTPKAIAEAIDQAKKQTTRHIHQGFGNGNSAQKFIQIMLNEGTWQTPKQKTFTEL
ncbi:MAG: UDP-N-acetylglucosamine 2-epimerase [Bernardetiaceae bacterium]|jgi:UDP-N-acetylglucosamine 2-epimerase (hydrolysing)|nr:UDP-N-acetylglucosamine 2-epimerase [Bernardetiaceae bacterium]